MNRIAKLIVLATVISAGGQSFARAASNDRTALSILDGACSWSAQNCDRLQPGEFAASFGAISVPAVPEAPVASGNESVKSEYFPVEKKVTYQYEYTSSEFQGTKTIWVEYLNYQEKDNAANGVIVFPTKSKHKTESYNIRVTASGIYASNSPLGGKRMEFPLPATVGRNWEEGTNTSKITTITAKVNVPAGDFTACLKVLTRLDGGDSGTSERFYAPGVGLIYENVMAENIQETIKLVSYRVN